MDGGDLTCARRTRAFPGRAFREHRGPPSVSPYAPTSVDYLQIITSFTLPGWQGGAALNCARPTRGVRDRALREQGGLSSLPATHLIPLLTQTSRYRIGIGRVRIERPVGAAH
jgi:hypothetical protein